MIAAFNAILECFVTGLFTAGILVFCTRMGWFPVIIMQTMTLEEAEEYAKTQQAEDDYEE